MAGELKIPGLKNGKLKNDRKSIQSIDSMRPPTEIKVNFCNKKSIKTNRYFEYYIC
jgi:hypothetical protein